MINRFYSLQKVGGYLFLFALLSMHNIVIQAMPLAKTINIKCRLNKGESIVIFHEKSDSLVVSKKGPGDENLLETKKFLLKLIGNDSIAIKAFQRALGLNVKTTNLGPQAIKKFFEKISNLNSQTPTVLIDQQTNIQYVLSLEITVVNTSIIGWLFNEQLLRIGHIFELGKKIDSLRIFYRPPQGYKVDSLNFQTTKELLSVSHRDTTNPAFVLKADSLKKITCLDSLLAGTSTHLRAFIQGPVNGAQADSTIVAEFGFLPDGQVGLLVKRSPSVPSSIEEHRYNPILTRWQSLSLLTKIIIVGLPLVSLVGIGVYRLHKSRQRRRQELDLLTHVKLDWLQNFQKSCADLFVEINAEPSNPTLKEEAKTPSSKKQKKSNHKAAKEEAQATHPANSKLNVTELKEEMTKVVATAWEARKVELAQKLLEQTESNKADTVLFPTLLGRVDNLCDQRQQIQQQTLLLLRTRHFLFGTIDSTTESALVTNKQSSLEVLNDHLGRLENALEVLQEQVGNGTSTVYSVVEKVKSRVQARDEAEKKLQEVSSILPVIFEPAVDQAGPIDASLSARNGQDLLELLEALLRWSSQYNLQRQQESADEIAQRFRRYAVLSGVDETETEIGHWQNHLSGGSMTREAIAKRTVVFRESKNFRIIVEEAENAINTEIAKHPAREQFGSLLTLLRSRFSELKQLLAQQPDLAKIHTELVAMFYAISEHQRELKIQRDALIEWQKRLQELDRSLEGKLSVASDLKDELGQKTKLLKESVDALKEMDQNLGSAMSNAIGQLKEEKIAYENARQQMDNVSKEREQNFSTELDKQLKLRESVLQKEYTREKSALEEQIQELKKQVSADQTRWEEEKSAIRTEHTKELQKVKNELYDKIQMLNQAIDNARGIENRFHTAEQNLRVRIKELETDLSKSEAERPAQSKLEAELKSLNKNIVHYQNYLRVPYPLHMTRELFLAMKPLFEGRLQGLAEASYSSLQDEYKKLRSFFEVLSTRLRLELGPSKPENLEEVQAALLKCESNRKEFMKNFVLVLATPFYRSHQLAYHIPKTNNDVRKAMAQNYRRFKAITAELGIHLHDLIIFQTEPNGDIHEDVGIGCPTPVLQEIYNNLRQKNLLPAPCITDVLRVGFESTVESIESERSVVRTFNG